MNVDTIVLGAGIIGVSVAVHLQKRGRSVVLIDRQSPGLETSFGNAGLIQREGVYPHAFPRRIDLLLKYAGNRAISTHYHPTALPRFAPFFFRYWRNSHPSQYADIARRYATLIEHCVSEHRVLAAEAGVERLLRPIGWIKVFRTAREFDAQTQESEQWKRSFGVNFQALSPAALRTVEPHLSPSLIGGLHYPDADSVSDPGALVQGYLAYFERLGGKFLIGDARSLQQNGNTWQVLTEEGPIGARSAVVALGPWAATAISKLGYRLRLQVKRGYHMHYATRGEAVLTHPVLDIEPGYLLAPMSRGIRLTTGVEFADTDAPKTPVQLDRAESIARSLFPLSDRLDPEPWMGMRPCTPDMMPVIGRAPLHGNLWFAFGHAHHGLTLGPVTGRLVAEMVTGEEPIVDPTPFRADRVELQ
jgi:D-amino-acid dehydrogenase